MKTSQKKKESKTKEPLAVGRFGAKVCLLYRQSENKIQKLFLVPQNGAKFAGRARAIILRYPNHKSENIARCRDFRFFSDRDKIILTYIFDGASASSLRYAVVTGKNIWVVRGTIKNVATPGILVPGATAHAGSAAYFGNDKIRLATSKNLKHWKVIDLPQTPAWHFYNGALFSILGALKTKEGIALFYGADMKADLVTDVSLANQKVGERRFVKVGASLFSEHNPAEFLWQTDLPLIEVSLSETEDASFLGIVPSPRGNKMLRFYFASRGQIKSFELAADVLADHRGRKPAALKKSPENPILRPTSYSWESEGAFNPTALHLGGKVHLLYRAVGAHGSHIGYASSRDGQTIDERLAHPAYSPGEPFESPGGETADFSESLFHSGGSWGGCEDPKLTQIDDQIYMSYVAHAGYWPTRTALTSISTDNFLKRIWHWAKPMLMSAPNVGSKSVVLLPERIGGQYVIFHRVWPNIAVDIVPELVFGEGKRWLQTKFIIPPRHSYWDSQKLSMGAAPLQTKKGWLAIYNAVDRLDFSRYKIGAMLLCQDATWSLIARTRKPILSPDEWYENDGKPGIAYPGGAVELDGVLHVYYGGADKVSCVATIETEELIWHILRDREPHLTIQPVALA